jgi:4-hydroxybenzoate polyprenyltransferase
MSSKITEHESSARIALSLLITMAWPAAAALSLSVAIGNQHVTAPGLVLIACGTMAAYGLDRLIDRRGLDTLQMRRALVVCVVIAAVITGILASTAWWRFQVCLALSLVAGAYVPLKKYVPKNVLTTFAWTVAIATLPFETKPVNSPEFRSAVLSVACIMAANTVLCDIPDFAADRKSGVRGITPRFGPRAGAIVALTVSLLGTFISAKSGHWGLFVTSAGLAVLAILQNRNPERTNHRYAADGLVTLLPGPITLLFG